MKVRKKPVVVEAIQVTYENIVKILELKKGATLDIPSNKSGVIRGHIKTLEGAMSFVEGDYIIIGVKGEAYPCRKDIFEETYEVVE